MTGKRSLRASAQRESRRTEILDGALRVFAEKGYHQAHVSDIIEAAGIARGTFYLYFESKSAIFIELLERLLEGLEASIVGVDTGPEDPPVEEQLVGTIRRVMDHVVRNRAVTTIVIREAVGLDEEVDQRLRDFYDRLLDYIRKSLEEGTRMGIIRDLDLEIASMCILGTIKQFMERLVLTDFAEVDVDRTVIAVLDYNLRGVLRQG